MTILDWADLSVHLTQLRRLARELAALVHDDLYEVIVSHEDGFVLRAFVEGRMWHGIISWAAMYDHPEKAVDKALAAVREAIERSQATAAALREKGE